MKKAMCRQSGVEKYDAIIGEDRGETYVSGYPP
jgi:hypothetical protein